MHYYATNMQYYAILCNAVAAAPPPYYPFPTLGFGVQSSVTSGYDPDRLPIS